jgi:AraC family transcriptional regulator
MKPDTRSHYATVVQRTLERIARQLDEALDLDTLAREACVAPFHFHCIFRGMVGETPLELARRLRLERAAWQLANTDRPVTEVAFDAGYEAHEAFTRAFRVHYDTSPTLFRARKYPRIELAARCGVHFQADGTIPSFIPRDSGGQHMHVSIKSMPELRLATVRHVGPYNQIHLAFERLSELLSAAAPSLRNVGLTMIAIYHDDPEVVPLDQLRSDAATAVPGDFAIPNGLAEQRVPAGRFACTLHVGPYEQLGDTWARFMGEWLPASGHRVGSAPSYEIYLNDPRMTPKADLRTELYIPLERTNGHG